MTNITIQKKYALHPFVNDGHGDGEVKLKTN